VTRLRNFLYDQKILKSFHPSIPSICVGNLSVGGTGKTPLVIYLAELLNTKYKVSILSRGYGRNTKGYVLLNAKHQADAVGDEPLNYFKKFPNIQVAVCEKRVDGYHHLMQEKTKTEVLLLDDAFQHRAFFARMNILVTPYHDLYVNDYVLPSGRLRESRAGAHRAQIIMVSKCPQNITAIEQQNIAAQLKINASQYLFFTKLQYSNLYHFQTHLALTHSALSEQRIYLFSGIGNNTPMVQFLKPLGQQLEIKTYPDHYVYQTSDILEWYHYQQSHPNTIFITTEKDAMRLAVFKDLKELQTLALYILPVNVIFTSAKGQDQFNQLILEYVRQD
jgi:tetraacyldisaccharide 4'-kinase